MAKKGSRRDLAKEKIWHEAIQRQKDSGISVRQFCEAEGLKDWSFHWWRREIDKRNREKSSRKQHHSKSVARDGETTSFVAVQVEPAVSSDHVSNSIDVCLPTGLKLSIPPSFDEQALSRILHVLESPRC